jgi:O-ureido-D-serine cyclo-ligase
VPTRFVEPGEKSREALDRFLQGGSGSLSVGAAAGFDDFVVKPSIGAGSRDAGRYRRADHDTQLRCTWSASSKRKAAVPCCSPIWPASIATAKRPVMYFAGRASHAIRKGPLLRVGSDLVSGLFAPEQITPREPGGDEQRLAAAAYASIPFAPPLYARIDIIRDSVRSPYCSNWS